VLTIHLYMFLTEHFENLGVDYLVTKQPTPILIQPYARIRHVQHTCFYSILLS